MNKIGILTFNRALNYGAVLQTYGLLKAVTNIDSKYDCEIINYKCAPVEYERKIKSRIDSNIIKSILRCSLLISKKMKFNNFCSTFLKSSSNIYDDNNISLLNETYDKIIVGSDQIWNLNITDNDFNYLLDFSLDKNKKYSYADSFGKYEIKKEDFSKFKEVLNEFRTISVREESSKVFLKNKLNIQNVEVNLDPTLLLNKEDWLLVKKNKIIKEKYILIYNVQKPDKIMKYAEYLKNKTGYKLYYIPIGIRPKNGKNFYPNVEEFLNLFYNAEYVLTNSFHGTVFSIIFNKKFMTELPLKNSKDERINSLLNICQLQSRVLEDNINDLFDDIDWKRVNNLLNIERQKSIDYLKNILNEE